MRVKTRDRLLGAGVAAILSVHMACAKSQEESSVLIEGETVGPQLSQDAVVEGLVESLTNKSTVARESSYSEDQKGLPTVEEFSAGMPALKYDLSEQRVESNYNAPSNVNLYKYDTPAKDQRSEGACTAFATVSAMENLARQRNVTLNLSEQHLWTTQRQQPHMGASADAARVVRLVEERVWPYQYSRPAGDLASRGLARLGDWDWINTGVSSILNTLKRGRPVIFGFATTNPLANSNGLVYVHTAESGFAHAVLISGAVFDSRIEGGGYFIIKNSWGRGYGDNGYIYMPFSFCKYHACWAIEPAGVSVSNAPDSGGDSDEESDGNRALAIKVKYGAKEGRYQRFSLYISAETDVMNQIKSVTYDVHTTFGSSRTYQTSTRANGFATTDYQTYAAGWDTNGATVHFKDGSRQKIAGVRINFPDSGGEGDRSEDEQPPKSLKVAVGFGANSAGYQEFYLYIDGTAADRSRIKSVTYDVHKTFGSNATYTVASSTERSTRFLTATYQTYASGWSTGGASVTLKSGQTLKLSGVEVDWN